MKRYRWTTILARVKALMRRSHAIENDPHSENERDEISAAQQQNDADRVVSAVEQSRDAILHEHRADRKQDEHESRLNRKVAIFTLVVVGLYTSVAFLQYCNMRDSLKHTREALRISERAYVNFGFADGKFMRLFPLEVGKPIMVAVQLQNSGRVPATRVVVNYGISRPIKPGMNESLQSSPYHHVTSCDPRKDDLSKHPDWIESIIPANAVETRYLFVPNDKLSPADIDTIKSLNSEIAVIGFVQYCDGFDKVQCMSFCASYKDDVRKDFVPCLRGITDYCPLGFEPPEQK
jgi:hypothetical protein